MDEEMKGHLVAIQARNAAQSQIIFAIIETLWRTGQRPLAQEIIRTILRYRDAADLAEAHHAIVEEFDRFREMAGPLSGEAPA